MIQTLLKKELTEEYIQQNLDQINIIDKGYRILDFACKFAFLNETILLIKYGAKTYNQHILYSSVWSNDLIFLNYIEQNINNNYTNLNKKKLVLCAMSNSACDEIKKYNIGVHLIENHGIDGKLFGIYALQSSEPLLKYLVENNLFDLNFNIGTETVKLTLNDYIKLSPNFIHPYCKYVLKNRENELFFHCYNNDLVELERCLNSGYCDLNFVFSEKIGTIYNYCKNNDKMDCLELILKYS